MQTDFDFKDLAQNWPSPIVAREEIGRFTGGAYRPRTLANLDSLGQGPPRIRIGRKVCYPIPGLINWLKSRKEEMP